MSACQHVNQTSRRAVRCTSRPINLSLIVFVDEVDDDFDHCVLFFGAAFGNHQSEGDEGVVSDALSAILVIKNAVAVEEPQEQCCGNANVAVAEGVVLSNEIQEHGCLFFHRWVKVNAAECLANMTDGAFERVALFVTYVSLTFERVLCKNCISLSFSISPSLKTLEM